jgi:cell division protein ZipA
LPELRWILLGIGIVAIGAIWWWSARRSRQAPGNAELRESTATAPHTLAPAAVDPPPVAPKRSDPGETRERGPSPLEPLSIRTADFEQVPALDQPMLTHADPLDIGPDYLSRPTGAPRFAAAAPQGGSPTPQSAPVQAAAPKPSAAPAKLGAAVPPPAAPQSPLPAAQPPLAAAASAAAPGPAAAPPSAAAAPASLSAEPAPAPPSQTSPPTPSRLRPSTENSDRLAAVAPQSANTSEMQKIVTLRVCAVGDVRWPGAVLMNTLELHGLAYGRYQVYHRRHSDGRSVFYVASLVEPGTFDLSSMANDEFRGVSMFAVLPGPLEPVQTVDALLVTARELARALSGTLQDAKGLPISPQRATELLEDAARFQAQLS